MRVTSRVDEQFLRRYRQMAQENLVKTADAMRTDLLQSQTIPFDTGVLQNDSTFVDDTNKERGIVTIVSDTPYARRLYFHPEYNFKRDKNSKAGGQWFNTYISGAKKNFASKTFRRFMQRSSL